MRFIIFVKSNQEIESGELPDPKLFSDMANYNDKLSKAGMLIALDGFRPSSEGVRIFFEHGNTKVINGPFNNPEELVAGYWVIKAGSKEEAIEWAKRVPFTSGVVEIRQIQEMSDFPPEIQRVAQLKK